jgi:hypothetical protein
MIGWFALKKCILPENGVPKPRRRAPILREKNGAIITRNETKITNLVENK